MNSLQARLNIGLVMVLVVLFAVQWFVVVYAIEHLTDEYIHTQLDHDAESILAAVTINSEGKLTVSQEHLSEVYRRPFSGHYYSVAWKNGVVRSRSLWDQELEFTPVNVGEVDTQYILGPLDHDLMLRVTSYEKQGWPIIIVTAHEVTDLHEDINELRFMYAGISIIAVLVLIALQMVVIKRSFAPLEQARTQLQAMERGEITQLDESLPSEIQPLAREINRLLSLLSQRLQRSRNAMGNLAHALKAPLTVINQLTSTPAFKKAPQLQGQIHRQTDMMRALVERELKRARIAGSAGVVQRFVPDKDIPPLVQMLENVYRSKDLAMDINYPEGVSTALDREDVMELLGNLLDNACKWAKRQVRLTVVASDDFIMIVEDDGPGVALDKIADLVKRGVRIDESTIGHGLGLSIVQDAISQYGGELEMGRSSKLGGFLIKVCIPVSNRGSCGTSR